MLRAAMMAGEARGLVSLGAGKRARRAVVAWLSGACFRVAALFCAVFGSVFANSQALAISKYLTSVYLGDRGSDDYVT